MGQLVGASAQDALGLEPARDLLPSVGGDLALPNDQSGAPAISMAAEATSGDPSDLTLISLSHAGPGLAAAQALMVDAPAMAPGLGGFNIDPPRASRTPPTVVRPHDAPEPPAMTPTHVSETASAAGPRRIIEFGAGPEGRGRASGWPVPGSGPNTFGLWIGRGSCILSVLTLFALIGVRVLPSLEAVPTADPPSHRHTAVHPARLIVTSQRGGENEPLPIGVSLQHGSGGETVIITGLEGGTELSLGSSLGPTAWLISAADLEQAFIAAPPSFLGVMRATANLRSSRDELLDSKVVSYEWAKINLREGRMTPAVDVPERSVPVVVALAPETLALLLKRAESLLQQGEVSAARVLLRRAAPHSGQAALELGMTFDQSLLTQWGVVGVEADEAEARRWYELAINLGSDEAVYHRRQLAGEPTDRDPSEAKPRAQP